MPGPVFTNLLLADEINRTPPKTQAAMLQAMQEREVTAGGETMPLPKPFHVFATQNPIEMEGTYQLPEAATDRFMLSVMIDYPEPAQEADMVRRTTGTDTPELGKVMSGEDLLAVQQLVRAVPVSDEVIRFAVDLVGATRPGTEGASERVNRFVRWGAGPRASQYLVLGAKGRAAMAGKPCADIDDVRSVAHLVLRHRVLTNFKARAEGVDTENLLDELGANRRTPKEPRPCPKPSFISTRNCWPAPATCCCWRNAWSRDTPTGCTAAPTPAAARNSLPTAPSSPATPCSASTGKSTAGPTTCSCANSSRRPTSAATCSWTRAAAWISGQGAGHKFIYGRLLCAVLAVLLHRQQDAPGLVVFGKGDPVPVEDWWPPSTRRDHLEHLVHHLETRAADGPHDHLRGLDDLVDECHRRSLAAFITDALVDPDELKDVLSRLRMRGTKVILFHLLAREELEPRIDDEVVLVDQETGAERAVDGAAYARLHAEHLARVLGDIEQVCHDTETEYCFLPTDQPLDEALRRFLLLRSG